LTALAGGAIYIEHLDERWLTVEIKPGEVISPGMLSLLRFAHHHTNNMNR
jgi:DnaJ family protein A protein 2